MLQKTNIPGYMRDDKTGMVVNMNDGELAMVLEKRRRKIEAAKAETTADRVDKIEDDVAEIKMMLKQLLSNKGG